MKLVVLTLILSTVVACSGAGPDLIVAPIETQDSGHVPSPDAPNSQDGGIQSPDASLDASMISDSCVVVPKLLVCKDRECGQFDDGCGKSYDCGTCSLPNSCGGGSTLWKCGCTPLDQATACNGRNCGQVSDSCGGHYTCGPNGGDCVGTGESCGGGVQPVPGVCGCTPKTVAQACGNMNCGSMPDGCGNSIQCGSCNGDTVCGVILQNHCDACPRDDSDFPSICPSNYPIPRRCPNTSYILPDCEVTVAAHGNTPSGQYCCNF